MISLQVLLDENLCVIEGKANTINICHILNSHFVALSTNYVKTIVYFNITLTVTL